MLQKILYNFDIAIEAIRRNKLRAFLTSLGIIFGVGSVIAMLAIGTGAQQEVLSQMQLLGTNNVIIQPVIEQEEGQIDEENATEESKRFSPGLTLEDLRSIQSVLPEIEFVSPEIVYETNFIRNARMRTGKLVGVNDDYFNINNFEVISGSNFSDAQIESSSPVCIIGYDVRSKFFAGQDPIGKKIKVGHLWLTVVGVLKKRDLSTENIESLGIRNYNLDIFAPATTVLLRFKNRALLTKKDLSGGSSTVFFGGGMMVSSNSSGKGGDGNYNQLDKLIVRVSAVSYTHLTLPTICSV